MSFIDSAKHDIQITLVADHTKGLWAYQMFTTGAAKSVRVGGRLPASAHAHTLLLLALTNALRSLTKKQHRAMAARRGTTKPNVSVIVLGGKNFVPALQKALGHEDGSGTMKAARSFLGIAAQQMARFNLDVSPSTDMQGRVVLQWLGQHVYPQSDFSTLPNNLLPLLASEVI